MEQNYKRRIRRLWIKSFLISLVIIVIGGVYFLITLQNRWTQLTVLSTRKECENFIKFAPSFLERYDIRSPVPLTVRPMTVGIDTITDQIHGNLTSSKISRNLFKISVDYEPLSKEHLRQLERQLDDRYKPKTAPRVGKWEGVRFLLTYKVDNNQFTPFYLKKTVTLVLSNIENNTLIRWGFGNDNSLSVGSESRTSLVSFWGIVVFACLPLLYGKHRASQLRMEHNEHQKQIREIAKRIEKFEDSLSTFRSHIIAAERRLRKSQGDEQYREILTISSEIFGSLLERLRYQSMDKKNEIINEANELMSAIEKPPDLSDSKSKSIIKKINKLSSNILHKYQ